MKILKNDENFENVADCVFGGNDIVAGARHSVTILRFFIFKFQPF